MVLTEALRQERQTHTQAVGLFPSKGIIALFRMEGVQCSQLAPQCQVGVLRLVFLQGLSFGLCCWQVRCLTGT